MTGTGVPVAKKKTPDLKIGGLNQKPLTIKPFIMKIHVNIVNNYLTVIILL